MPQSSNYLSNNVHFVSSTANLVSLPMMKRITAVKYFSGTNSSAAILSGSSSAVPGSQLWFENATTGHVTDLLSIYCPEGVTVSLGGGASVFVYGTVSLSV